MLKLKSLFSGRLWIPISCVTVIFFSINLVHCRESLEQREAENLPRVLLPLEQLPETFSNENLPNATIEANLCVPLIGCMTRMPIKSSPQDTSKLGTIFKISRRSGDTVIPFEHVLNCSDKTKNCVKFPFNFSLLLGSSFNATLRTIIITGGWRTSAFNDWQTEMKDRWLDLEDVNVISVGWPEGNKDSYEVSVANSKVVARQITVFLYYLAKLHNRDIKDESFLSTLHLIGHSLGAHISGFVGSDLAGKVNRITGLDPAGPIVVNFSDVNKLDASDAQLVVVLHTNGGQGLTLSDPRYGIEKPFGHIDYYGNDGEHQIHCNIITDLVGCSHRASYEYYTYLLNHEINIRRLMRNKEDQKRHRLSSYLGSNFKEFKYGTSLAKKHLQMESDLSEPDFDHCSVPIDFTSTAEEFTLELKQKHNISLNSTYRFYFLTVDTPPYLNRHNLLKIVLQKRNMTRENLIAQIKLCDIQVEISEKNKSSKKYQLKDYDLISDGQHYVFLIPFLTANMTTKYDLASLDEHDFFTQDKESLIGRLKMIMPSSISVTGTRVILEDSNNRKSGLTDTKFNPMSQLFEYLFPTGKHQGEAEGSADVCASAVERIIVKPLIRLSRNIVVSYTPNSRPDGSPTIFVANNETTSDTMRSKFQQMSEFIGYNLEIESSARMNKDTLKSVLYLNGVIVGGHDSQLNQELN